MHPTSPTAEQLVREFATTYPGPHVLLAVELCETGRITWDQAAALFAKSYGKALEEVYA